MAAEDLTPEELDEIERRKREKKPTLDEEIAAKYEPQRLSKIVLKGAGRGERLDLATRSEMERILPGTDFSGVRVFRGALAEEVTSRHQADAVTIGNTGMIMMRESPRSAPGTTAHKALLAHELTHVAQAQKGMFFAREAHEDAAAPHEQEARSVEKSVSDKHFKHDEADDARKTAAKRKRIIDRVLEMLEEQTRLHRERNGEI